MINYALQLTCFAFIGMLISAALIDVAEAETQGAKFSYAKYAFRLLLGCVAAFLILEIDHPFENSALYDAIEILVLIGTVVGATYIGGKRKCFW